MSLYTPRTFAQENMTQWSRFSDILSVNILRYRSTGATEIHVKKMTVSCINALLVVMLCMSMKTCTPIHSYIPHFTASSAALTLCVIG